jgi:DNA-binding MarR family transcriptional regulator
VLCHITPKGQELIDELDEPMDAANQRAGLHLDEEERQQLVDLLGAVRAAVTNGRAATRDQGSVRVGQPPR